MQDFVTTEYNLFLQTLTANILLLTQMVTIPQQP